ncbi:MAG: NifU family protein [Spartobacteria bacterium]
MEKSRNQEIQGRLARIEELIQAVDKIDNDKVRTQARELVEALLEMQGAGLERLMEIIYDSGPTGQAMIDDLGHDELVSSLLLVHGLHPLDLESRVRGAIEKVGPRLAQHGGSVEFLSVSREGALKLRLAGNCHGCPSSILTLKFSIEEAIYAAAPDITSLEVEGATPLDPPPSAEGANGAAPVAPQFTECPAT